MVLSHWLTNILFTFLYKIEAHPSVAGHVLFDLEGVKKSTSTEPTLLLVDIAGYVSVVNNVFYSLLWCASGS